MTGQLKVLLAKQEITEGLSAYCRGVDRIDETLIRRVLHPDAEIDYGLMFAGGVSEFVAFIDTSHKCLLAHTHQVGSITITVDGDLAGSECYVTAWLRGNNPEGGLTDITTAGRYLDRWAVRDGAWRISRREYVHALDVVRDAVGLGFKTADTRDLTDPCYQVLARPTSGRSTS